jgi:N-hydroxyarylamine O-acetyltransferase
MNEPDFDLEGYLRRIGVDGPRQPTLSLLSALCVSHPASIPFENIDPLLGRTPSLRLRDLQSKLVGQRRGGYCFEHNTLLRQALLALGFGVTSLAARVVWMAAPGAPQRPRTHMLLGVDIPGDAFGPYLVDAGFGGHLVDLPLRLQPGVAQAAPGGSMRIAEEAGLFALETQLAGCWSPLYRFTLDAQTPADYEPLNWFTATHPTSMFRHNLLMEQLKAGVRATLLNDRLTLRTPGHAAVQRRIESPDEFSEVLESVFGVRPPVPAAELFERLPRGHDGVFVPAVS